jgi:hypothetical protein
MERPTRACSGRLKREEAQGGPGLAMTALRPVTERPVMTKTILVEAV